MKDASSLYEETIAWYNNIVGDAAAAQFKAVPSGGEAAINSVLTKALTDLRKTVDPSYILDIDTKRKIVDISKQMSEKGAASFLRSGKGELRRGIIKSIGSFFGAAESPSDFFEAQYRAVKELQKERGVDSRPSIGSAIRGSGSRTSPDSSVHLPLAVMSPTPPSLKPVVLLKTTAKGDAMRERAAAAGNPAAATAFMGLSLDEEEIAGLRNVRAGGDGKGGLPPAVVTMLKKKSEHEL